MKKFLASVFVCSGIFCLTACSAPIKTADKPESHLSSPFSAKMTVALDKLNAEAAVNRFGEGCWDAEFDSPNTLSGVKLSFDSGNVTAEYKGLSFSVPKSALPVKAMLVNLIDAVDQAAAETDPDWTDQNGSPCIKGKLDGGEYTVIVDSKGYISSFEMPNNNLKITFTDLIPQAECSPTPTEIPTSYPAVCSTENETAAAENPTTADT